MYYTEAEQLLELKPPYSSEDLKRVWKEKARGLHSDLSGREDHDSRVVFSKIRQAKLLLEKRLSDPSYVQDSQPGDPDYRAPEPKAPPQPPRHSRPVPPQPPGRDRKVPPQPPPKRGPGPPPPPAHGYRTGRPGPAPASMVGTIRQGVPGSDVYGRRMIGGPMQVSVSKPLAPDFVDPSVVQLVGQKLIVSKFLLDGRTYPAPGRLSSWVALTSGKRGGRLAIAFQPPTPFQSFNRVEASVYFEEDRAEDAFDIRGPVVERCFSGNLVSLVLVELEP